MIVKLQISRALVVTDGHVVHLHLVGHEGEDDVLRHEAQEAEQAHVGSKHHVAPAELPPEIQIHGGALAGDQEYLQQEAAGFTL